MKSSILKNPRALIAGAISAIIIFAAMQIAFTAMGPRYANEAQPGSITVRPIVKDTAVKDMTMSVVIALAGGFMAARAVHRRGGTEA